MIKAHEDVLHSCAALLMEKEKIGRDEFEALFGAKIRSGDTGAGIKGPEDTKNA